MRISDWSSDVCSSDLVAVRGEIGREDAAEILLRRAVWRAVIVGEIDMRDAAIERAAQHRAAGFEHVRAAEILPQAKADRGQIEPAVAKIGRASCRERVCQYL